MGLELLLPLIMALLSFFLSKKNGASTGKAALVAAGTGALTYGGIKAWQNYKTTGSIWGVTHGGETDASGSPGATMPTSQVIGSTLSSLGQSAADVAKSWGPAGTAAAAIGVANGSKIIDFVKTHPWLAGGALLATLVVLRS